RACRRTTPRSRTPRDARAAGARARYRRSCSSARTRPPGRRQLSPLVSVPSPRHPDLLARPLLGPAAVHEVPVLLGRAVGRVQLVERLDLEAGVAQQRDPLAVGLVEVDLLPPVDPLEPALRALQGLGARALL